MTVEKDGQIISKYNESELKKFYEGYNAVMNGNPDHQRAVDSITTVLNKMISSISYPPAEHVDNTSDITETDAQIITSFIENLKNDYYLSDINGNKIPKTDNGIFLNKNDFTSGIVRINERFTNNPPNKSIIFEVLFEFQDRRGRRYSLGGRNIFFRRNLTQVLMNYDFKLNNIPPGIYGLGLVLRGVNGPPFGSFSITEIHVR
jgi:hypothetical protein